MFLFFLLLEEKFLKKKLLRFTHYVCLTGKHIKLLCSLLYIG